MNIKKLFVTAAVCVMAFVSANAQVIKGAEAQTVRGPYETNGLFDNVFIGVAGGFNYYQGEQDLHLDFKDRLAPAVQGYIGKWISPCFGIRLGYYGIKANGFYYNVYAASPAPAAYAGNPYVDKVDTYDFGYKQKMNLHQVRGDLMWNISNALGGYRSDRFWDIAPYIGAGAAIVTDPDGHNASTELIAAVGIYNMFRVCKSLDVTLDITQAVVNQSLDAHVARSRQEYIGSVSLGLAYQFKNREFSRAHAPVDVTPFNNKIKDLSNALEDINAKNKKLADDLAAEKAKTGKGETVYVPGETKYTPAPFAVYFPLGKSTLTEDQKASIKYFVNTSMATNKDRVFEIEGAADSATGSAKTNERLGQARLDAVLNIIKACGGNYKLAEKNLGGTMEFSQTDKTLNRVVVIK
jgi:outer membrane protein OmpA-like peptidoglycan-associated protein